MFTYWLHMGDYDISHTERAYDTKRLCYKSSSPISSWANTSLTPALFFPRSPCTLPCKTKKVIHCKKSVESSLFTSSKGSYILIVSRYPGTFRSIMDEILSNLYWKIMPHFKKTAYFLRLRRWSQKKVMRLRFYRTAILYVLKSFPEGIYFKPQQLISSSSPQDHHNWQYH